MLASAQVASAASKDKQPVFDFATESPVKGAFSMVNRSEDGIDTKVRTSATPGNANTLWYVVFNAPENCSDGMCGEDDIFVNPTDPSEGFNMAQVAAARISVLWSGAGAIANAGGRLNLDGGLAEGEVPGGPNQVAIGLDVHNPVFPAEVTGAVVTGLEDARAAEVHIVIQDHGAPRDDPGMLNMQLTQFQGACNPDCQDVQFAVHK